MRFKVEIGLEAELIPKDKNRIILSILKNCFNSYEKEYYKSLYENKQNRKKEFTFALNLSRCEFLKESILIPSKKIYIYFSAYNYEDGIMFYNSFLKNKGKSFPIKDNKLIIGGISLIKEKTIFTNEAVFKTMSPIVIREHYGDNKKTWYHSFDNEEGQIVFRENLKYQIKDALGSRAEYDFENSMLQVLGDNKKVRVKNYGIAMLCNLCKVYVKTQPYILDYLYKAGIGSKRGSGFGMVDIL